MIPLRELDLETRGRSPPVSESVGTNIRDQGPDTTGTTGLGAAVNPELESSDVPLPVAADITPLRETDGNNLPPTAGSSVPTDQETAHRHRPVQAKSSFRRLFEKIDLASTTLGFILAVILGVCSWIGLNYANYYAKKSYDLALYQACRSDETLGNSTACRASLAAGITTRSISNIGHDIGVATSYVRRYLMDGLATHLRVCEKGSPYCLVTPSSPEASYSNFMSSIPKIGDRLLWALIIRYVAFVSFRGGIIRLHVRFEPTPLSIFLPYFFSVVDLQYALATGALSGQISWLSAASWVFYFQTTAAQPILSATRGLNRHRLLLLFASFMVLAPSSAGISNVGQNAALATVSLACFFLDHYIMKPTSVDKELLQEEGALEDRVTLPRIIGTLQADTLEQDRVDESVDDRLQPAGRPRENELRKRKNQTQAAPPKPGHSAPQGEYNFAAEEESHRVFDCLWSAAGIHMCFKYHLFGLWLSYLVCYAEGGLYADMVFCGACCLHLFFLVSEASLFIFAKNFRKVVVERGGTIEDISSYEQMREDHIFYSILGLVAATLTICISGLVFSEFDKEM